MMMHLGARAMRIRVYQHTGCGERLFQDTPLVLVSRFNLYSPVYADLQSPEWDEKRVAAFKCYLLPSLLRQKIKPDAFYLAIDENVSPPVAALIKELSPYKWIRPLKVPRSLGFNHYGKAVSEAIERDFPNRRGVICVRVDSDDSLNTHYFNALEAAIKKYWDQAKEKHPITFFHFSYGLIKDDELYRVYVEHETAFICSYTLGSANLVTCCDFAHDRMSDAGPVIEIATEIPMWLYVRHGANIGNIHPYRFAISGQFSDVASTFGLHEYQKAT